MTNQPHFDVFLAHNSQDKPLVKQIAARLMQRGLYYWIDEERIRPGQPFQDVIQQAIPVVKSAVIFIGLEGLGRWEDWELKIIQSQCVKAGIPVIPVLLPGVEEIPEKFLFLQQLNWVSFANEIDDIEALDRLEWGITGQKPQLDTVLANRTPELKCFLQMVRHEILKRILLLKAPSGFGKSELLRKFRQRCPQEVLVVRLDLKTAKIGIPYFFNHVCEELGYHRFQEFTTKLRQMLSGAENLSEYEIEWQQAIQTALTVEETQRQSRLAVLQRAFFQDLEAIDQTVVLLLDTFEKTVTELQDWINRELLKVVSRRLSRLIVVIAGQEVPEPKNSTWDDCCQHYCLDPIEDEESWYTFARDKGLSLDRSAIETTISNLKTYSLLAPLMVSIALESLAKQRS